MKKSKSENCCPLAWNRLTSPRNGPFVIVVVVINTIFESQLPRCSMISFHTAQDTEENMEDEEEEREEEVEKVEEQGGKEATSYSSVKTASLQVLSWIPFPYILSLSLVSTLPYT